MALKFGHRKLGISPAEWAAKNTVHNKTAGGRFGHRKLGLKSRNTLDKLPTEGLPGREPLDPPPTDIAKIPVPAALKKIRDENSPLGEYLRSELSRTRNGKPNERPVVIQDIRDQAEARGDLALVEVANAELDRIKKALEDEE
jgi:hypothetical protein